MIWQDNNLLLGDFIVGKINDWPGKGYQALCLLPGVRQHLGIFDREIAKKFVEDSVKWWMEGAGVEHRHN